MKTMKCAMNSSHYYVEKIKFAFILVEPHKAFWHLLCGQRAAKLGRPLRFHHIQQNKSEHNLATQGFRYARTVTYREICTETDDSSSFFLFFLMMVTNSPNKNLTSFEKPTPSAW